MSDIPPDQQPLPLAPREAVVQTDANAAFALKVIEQMDARYRETRGKMFAVIVLLVAGLVFMLCVAAFEAHRAPVGAVTSALDNTPAAAPGAMDPASRAK